MNEISAMIDSFEREGLEADWDGMMFFPCIHHEAKDIRKAQAIVSDFGFTLKLYMPGDKSIDFDAEYEIIKES